MGVQPNSWFLMPVPEGVKPTHYGVTVDFKDYVWASNEGVPQIVFERHIRPTHWLVARLPEIPHWLVSESAKTARS